MKPKKWIPESRLFVWVCDHDTDGTPGLCVARRLDEINEDCPNTIVGEYQLTRAGVFEVERKLKFKTNNKK